MGRVRNTEGYERLAVLVGEIVGSSFEKNGLDWLDETRERAPRQRMLVEVREIVREIRRTEPEHQGISSRKRWIEMAFDEAVEALMRHYDSGDIIEFIE